MHAQTALAEFFTVQSHQWLIWGVGESQAPAGSDIIAMQQAQLESLSRAANGRFMKMSHDKSDVEAMGRYIKNNLALIQGIIDEVNRYSQSQKEEGASSKELGDEPQTGDGAEKQLLKQQLIEQYTAEQLLLDPALNEMWLRQVQKNPARFLANKFQAQHQGASQ